MSTNFVHLHVHSQYSMLDSTLRLKSLVARAQDEGMPAVALTDHDNMFGAVQFHNACRAASIKPILGCEVNLCEDHTDRSRRDHRHLLLLARTQAGYQNLVKLVSLAWVEGSAHGKRFVDFAQLAAHREGIIGLSACMGGYLAQEILHKGEQAGRVAMERLRDCFEPGRFYVELQDHSFVEQRPVNEILIDTARALELPLVASNDCHYMQRDHARAQMVLQSIAAGVSVAEMERGHHGSEEVFFKSASEMREVFKDLPEACDNTLAIAEMIEDVDPIKKPMLPRFPVPDDTDEAGHFRLLAQQGLEERFKEFENVDKDVDREAYRERLQMECDVICQMGFPGYFLIVQDFINWAKQHDIPVGPGRGSGAGSLVAYSMRITDLDPIPYGLLFERFLNPERVSMPDFDVDFCMDRRDEVIDYVRDKYGATSVGQIATFHLLKSRSVVRDVGRVMGMTPQDAGRIATMVPEPVQGKSVPIETALSQEKRLREAYEGDADVKELLDTAQSLEDLNRHAGMHAAGVVISEGPLWDHVPVFTPEEDVYVTQYDKNDVEAAGLVKFDFLGLKTLTTINIASRLINKRPDRAGDPFLLERIPLSDATTFNLLQSGETTNVFQLESSGMQALIKQLKPDCFEDIVALVALYRPGPLGSGMVEDFVASKHGKKQAQYPHECLRDALKETFGIMVYQEQVMEAARVMAGYSLGGADLLRRAMGKKKPEEMAKQKVTFVDGARKNGHSAEDAERVFELMSYFSGYGFNKSHSAAYALISYQCAYLKAHFPVEFLCATMTADQDKIDKVVRTVAEARAMGITVLPPDVNESAIDFSVVYSPPDKPPTRKRNQPAAQGGKLRDAAGPRIRFGLGAIKGVGQAALESIFETRTSENSEPDPFVDMFDFTQRVDLRRVNKGVVEALIQCGAFDTVHGRASADRDAAMASVDRAIAIGKKAAAERESGQTDLFGMLGEGPENSAGAALSARKVAFETPEAPWSRHEQLQRERSTLGFYISGHPLDGFGRELKRFCNATTASVGALEEGSGVSMGGVIEDFRERKTKTGGKIAFFHLEDPLGRVEVIVRDRAIEKFSEVLHTDVPVLVSGIVRPDRDRGAEGETQGAGVKVLLDEVAPLVESLRAKTKSIRVNLHVDSLDRDKLLALRRTLDDHPGRCPVTLRLRSSDAWQVTLGTGDLRVDPSDAMMNRIERLFGKKVCELR